ncbi:MAG: hypothetical protein M9958_03305 [Chitinophagales bacterium]|nr:hypothetical protein [Chitinophagales bacterium]
MKLTIHITSKGSDAVFVATYQGKLLKRLERKRGTLSNAQWDALMKIVPPSPEQIDEYINRYFNVQYERAEPTSQSLFATLLDIYTIWYQGHSGITPRINGITGMHLNQCIAFLRKQSADDNEVQIVFENILNNWHKLPDFYQKQIELRQINSNLNIILNFLKNGQSDSKSKANSLSDDFRRSI